MNTRHEQPLMEQHQGGVGPYRFGRRLRVGEGLGRVYEARNEETGNPAYVVTPTGARVDLAPDVALQYLVTTSVRPAFIACELVSVPSGADASAVEAEMLDTSEDVMDMLMAAGATKQRLVHLLTGRAPVPRRAPPSPVSAPRAIRPARALRLVTALSLAAAGVLLAVQVSAPTPEPEPFDEMALPELPREQAVFTAGFASGAGNRLPERYRVPDAPFKGQKEAPCSGQEVAINGGCWLKLDAQVPCPKQAGEWKGGCYIPVSGSKPDNVSGPGGLY
ncbi:hypothetical protein [Corallococcus sp. AS-1-6]|uniref:hypothetical protein n=1 Tax=Corallococcus sp. AS-1-6 TaxID=2874599 RepID=UPI001CBCD424|nr:hypothetical protein [Corallococcus sp. AS-1-6]MBZ4371492.1 hypothetical protein [Corallococcus sp. AS-1-6]